MIAGFLFQSFVLVMSFALQYYNKDVYQQCLPLWKGTVSVLKWMDKLSCTFFVILFFFRHTIFFSVDIFFFEKVQKKKGVKIDSCFKFIFSTKPKRNTVEKGNFIEMKGLTTVSAIFSQAFVFF